MQATTTQSPNFPPPPPGADFTEPQLQSMLCNALTAIIEELDVPEEKIDKHAVFRVRECCDIAECAITHLDLVFGDHEGESKQRHSNVDKTLEPYRLCQLIQRASEVYLLTECGAYEGKISPLRAMQMWKYTMSMAKRPLKEFVRAAAASE